MCDGLLMGWIVPCLRLGNWGQLESFWFQICDMDQDVLCGVVFFWLFYFSASLSCEFKRPGSLRVSVPFVMMPTLSSVAMGTAAV